MLPQIEIAITILSALLTGGFILFFVENQHIESDVIHRYHAIMDPYYHKLSLYLKFVYFINYRIRYTALNKENYSKFKSLVDNLANLGSRIHISGKDSPYRTSLQLEGLNKDINNVWYLHDKNQFIREDINLDNSQIFPDSQITEVLTGLSGKYASHDIDKKLLPKVSGDFYCEIWEPVENVTYEFENWQKRCTAFKKLLITSIVFVMVVLVFAMICGYILYHVYFTAPTILSCLAFVFILYKINALMALSHKIFK